MKLGYRGSQAVVLEVLAGKYNRKAIAFYKLFGFRHEIAYDWTEGTHTQVRKLLVFSFILQVRSDDGLIVMFMGKLPEDNGGFLNLETLSQILSVDFLSQKKSRREESFDETNDWPQAPVISHTRFHHRRKCNANVSYEEVFTPDGDWRRDEVDLSDPFSKIQHQLEGGEDATVDESTIDVLSPMKEAQNTSSPPSPCRYPLRNRKEVNRGH